MIEHNKTDTENYYAVRYDKSHESIHDINTIITVFKNEAEDTYYKTIIKDNYLIIVNIKHPDNDRLLVRINDLVIVDNLGIRVYKKDINITQQKINNIIKLTPIKLKMKYEKETDNKIIRLSNNPYKKQNQIKEYIYWLEEEMIKLLK